MRIANTTPVPDIAIAVTEIMTNAVEHGNLGISYKEKTEYVSKGTWTSVVSQLLDLPEHAAKYVDVFIKKYPKKMTVLIEDQGPGFDFRKYLKLDGTRLFDNHGRGIAIANSCLELEYLGSGNRVLVTIPFEN